MTETDLKMPPFSIIPKHTAEEIDGNDLVLSKDEMGNVLIHFIDLIGRLWVLPLNDCIVIRNTPTQRDLDNFIRLKFEAEQSHKDYDERINNPPKKPVKDMSIGYL